MVCAGHRLSILRGSPGIPTTAPFYSRESGVPRRGMAGQAHPAQGSEHQDSNLGPLDSDAVYRDTSLSVPPSQKAHARCQALLPPSEFIWDRPVVLPTHGRPQYGPLGPGQCSLDYDRESGSWGKARLSSPSFPALPSSITGRLPPPVS